MVLIVRTPGFEPRNKWINDGTVNPYNRFNILTIFEGSTHAMVKIPTSDCNVVSQSNIKRPVHSCQQQKYGSNNRNNPHPYFDGI